MLPRRFATSGSNNYRTGPKKALWTSRAACATIQNLLEEAGGSFSCLEPSAQALVQATAKAVVHRDALPLDGPTMLWLVKTVPLLHASDYECLLLQATKLKGKHSDCERLVTQLQ